MTTFTYSPLLTDLYQLTMAYGYWKLNLHNKRSVFHLLFRKHPFKSNYALNCGLESILSFFENWHFKDDDLAYLATLTNTRGDALFPNAFLDYLKTLQFTCNVDAIPEGTIVFANEPLLRIEGPIVQCQLIETPLLNMINFQTLIATKASRVCRSAQGDEVIEFGMRRAQGPDGALSASRAAYIGGCNATSNTLAGKLYDIPVKGTHAHSWVTAFKTESEAFTAYADVMPHNCALLVDTFNTIQGVKNAIEVGKKLREHDDDLLAIRLDSGDMASLSIKARQMLDEAGFEKTAIIASNSLDEYVINNLKQQNAKISSWGVGTNLVTAYDHPALDGVYKLTAIQNDQSEWEYKLKLSEQEVKVTNPGRHQIRRFFCNERYVIDVIYDLSLGIGDNPQPILLDHSLKNVRLDDYDAYVDLMQPVLSDGKRLTPPESIHTLRKNALFETQFFINTHHDNPYPVALEKNLYELKQKLISQHKR